MEIETVITFIVGLLLGAGIGAALMRGFAPAAQKQKALEEELAKVEGQQRAYREQVNEHFVRASALVQNLTQSYREVHEHLSAGAVQLTDAETSRKMLKAGDGSLVLDQEMEYLSGLEPPRDYAPTPPGGVLSENYGLQDVPQSPPGTLPLRDKEENDDPTLRVG